MVGISWKYAVDWFLTSILSALNIKEIKCLRPVKQIETSNLKLFVRNWMSSFFCSEWTEEELRLRGFQLAEEVWLRAGRCTTSCRPSNPSMTSHEEKLVDPPLHRLARLKMRPRMFRCLFNKPHWMILQCAKTYALS